MNRGKSVLMAAGITLAVTVLLSLVPQWNRDTVGSRHGRDVSVFQIAPVKRITSDNLVDSMVSLQLKLPIRRVDWQRAVLSVDLAVEDEGEQAQQWMDDLERLLRLSLIQADNINRVLVRFVMPAPASQPEDALQAPAAAIRASRLVAAVDVRRADSWLVEELPLLSRIDPVSDIVWRERLRMTFSGSGNKADSFGREEGT